MASILVDFAALSTIGRMSRCVEQLRHITHILIKQGHTVYVHVDNRLLQAQPWLVEFKYNWVRDVRAKAADIYLAKSDAFYYDNRYSKVNGLRSFKVCLCNSDRCFRERRKRVQSTGIVRNTGHGGYGNDAVQARCDLYMPANHSEGFMLKHGHKTIPVLHAVSVSTSRRLEKMGLYQDFLDDNVTKIRSALHMPETRIAGFLGNHRPFGHRQHMVDSGVFPSFCDFKWARFEPADTYLRWMMARTGCIDLRGGGDKNIRLTEGIMLGRTIITLHRPSTYMPPIVNKQNGLIADTWDKIDWHYDKAAWKRYAEAATEDYLSSWSIRAMVKTILERAGVQ